MPAALHEDAISVITRLVAAYPHVVLSPSLPAPTALLDAVVAVWDSKVNGLTVTCYQAVCIPVHLDCYGGT